MDTYSKARGFPGNCVWLAYILPVLFAVILPLAACRSVSANADDERKKLDEGVDDLKKQFGIASPVQVEVVAKNRRGFSVERTGTQKFTLLVDANFVRLLDDEELTAALAHELAHVWIYTHHPFLHTETLANQIAMQVVGRHSLEQLYVKVSTFYGDRQTIDEVLGPEASLRVSTEGVK